MLEFINKIGLNPWFMLALSTIISGVLGWFFARFGNKIAYDEKRNFLLDSLSDIGSVIYVTASTNNGSAPWRAARALFQAQFLVLYPPIGIGICAGLLSTTQMMDAYDRRWFIIMLFIGFYSIFVPMVTKGILAVKRLHSLSLAAELPRYIIERLVNDVERRALTYPGDNEYSILFAFLKSYSFFPGSTEDSDKWKVDFDFLCERLGFDNPIIPRKQSFLRRIFWS